MKERPILFSGPMVRAILDGRKTQTRRVVKPSDKTWADGCASRIRYERHPFSPSAFVGTPAEGRVPGADRMAWVFYDWVDNPIGVNEADWLRSPYGTIGDRLWVRETWCQLWENGYPAYDDDSAPRLMYAADGVEVEGVGYRKDGTPSSPWVPSIHMPRWASRLTLEITGVRIERVQDISEADAMAEGLKGLTKDGSMVKWGIPDADGLPGDDDHGWHWRQWATDPRNAYRTLWDSINAARPGCSWESNPWVWIVEFRRVEGEVSQ